MTKLTKAAIVLSMLFAACGDDSSPKGTTDAGKDASASNNSNVITNTLTITEANTASNNATYAVSKTAMTKDGELYRLCVRATHDATTLDLEIYLKSVAGGISQVSMFGPELAGCTDPASGDTPLCTGVTLDVSAKSIVFALTELKAFSAQDPDKATLSGSLNYIEMLDKATCGAAFGDVG